MDTQTAEAVIALFKRLSQAGKTIIMVTHDGELARQGSRIVTVAEGRILEADGAAADG